MNIFTILAYILIAAGLYRIFTVGMNCPGGWIMLAVGGAMLYMRRR
jgi:hypothetical protein